MRAAVVWLTVAMAVTATACRNTVAPSVGIPALYELSPATVTAGSGPHTITLHGARFTPGSQARVYGEDLPTVFVDAQTLRVTLDARWTEAQGAVPFAVYNGDQLTSGFQVLEIRLPAMEGWTLQPVAVPGGSWDVAVTPTGDVLVGGFYSGRLTRLQAATGAILDTVTTAMWPYDVAIDAARGLAFTAGLDVGRVDVIDLDAFSVTHEFSLPTRPIRIALDQDGPRLFATTLSDFKLVALDAGTGVVEAGALEIGGIGNGLALTPDGARLWVTTTNGLIHRVNPSTLAIEQTSTPGGVPQDIVVNVAGSRAYVAHEDGWVSVLDAVTGVRLDSIPVASPFGLALEPGTGRLWVASARRGEVIVLDLETGRIVGGFAVGGAPRTIAFDSAGRAYIANELGLVHVATPSP